MTRYPLNGGVSYYADNGSNLNLHGYYPEGNLEEECNHWELHLRSSYILSPEQKHIVEVYADSEINDKESFWNSFWNEFEAAAA